jgi:uncharacterized protein YjbI with pentapeptide repeats
VGVARQAAKRTGERLVIDQQSLVGADFSGQLLDEFVSVGSRFESCQFRGMRIDHAGFGSGPSQSKYVDCVFDGSRFRWASGDARFVRCSFRDVNLRSWDSSATELVGCTFTGRLRKSVFYGRRGGVMAMETGPSPLLLRRIWALAPFGQVTVLSPRLMSKSDLVNMPPAAVGCWVLHREPMSLSSR